MPHNGAVPATPVRPGAAGADDTPHHWFIAGPTGVNGAARNGRPPLSASKNTPPSTRKERRAAERRDRFEAARADRQRGGSSSGGGKSLINTQTMTIAGVVIGILVVAIVAIGQLGDRASGKLTDPAIEYPAAVMHDNVLGDANAPVTMETYGDFQCPVCARNSLDSEPGLVAKYVTTGKLRIIHHDIDMLGRGGDESLNPALGAYCALEQGKYWDYAHWVFQNQDGENAGGFVMDRVTKIAVAAGLDEAKFTACVSSQAAKDAVAAISNKAMQEMGINSTPTIYLNGTQYVGLKSTSEWSSLIDALLNPATPSPAASAAASPSASASTNP